MPYYHQNKPLNIPVPDGKIIQEHTGLATTGNKDLSIAHMIAPPHWGEPFQQPAFDEYTLVSRGSKQVEVDDAILIIKAGESILVKAGSRVRYSNPFDEECEYWSVCLPAFSIETVKRDAQ
jgi:mannose-6-phosphate isomerase-like protein (cupin superfamily)